MPLVGRRKPGFAMPDLTNGPVLDTIREEKKHEEPVFSELPDFPAPSWENPSCEGEMLAGFVRMQCSARQLVSMKALAEEEPGLPELLAEMRSLTGCSDIMEVQGALDTYLYSSQIMSGFYAMMTVLAREHIPERTIAEMVRYNCKVYPSATPEGYFELKPFSMTAQEISSALDTMAANPEYQDICRVCASNGIPYLYSSMYFDDQYGKAMADYAEEDDG